MCEMAMMHAALPQPGVARVMCTGHDKTPSVAVLWEEAGK